MKITSGDPKFDLRTLQRAIREGRITSKEAGDYLKKLPDEASHVHEIHLKEEKNQPTPAGKETKRKGKSGSAKGPTFAPASEAS